MHVGDPPAHGPGSQMSPLGYIGAMDGPASVLENVAVDANPLDAV
jgi:hypothetical protein